MNFIISAINTIIDFAIPKAKVFLKSVPRLDKKCKNVQMKAKRLKKIQKREKTEQNQENFGLAQAENRQVIAKAKKVVYHKSRKEICAFFKDIWKVVKYTQNRMSKQVYLLDI